MSDISKISLNGTNYDIKDTTSRNSIVNIDNRLSDIESKLSKNFIIIGDSYGLDDSAGGKSWATIVKNKYPMCYRTTVGGTGFGSDVYMSVDWLSMLQGLTIEDKNSITAIYCIGGANDGNLIFDGRLTTTALSNKINNFCEYVKNNFPNAMVYGCFIGWYLDYPRFSAFNSAKECYKNAASNNINYTYIGGFDNIMHNISFINSSDKIHPTQPASNKIGECMLNVINAKSNYCELSYSTTPVITPTGCTISAIETDGVFTNDIFNLNIVPNTPTATDFSIRWESGINFSYQTLVKIGTISNSVIGGAKLISITVPGVIGYDVSTEPVHVKFMIQNGNVYVQRVYIK